MNIKVEAGAEKTKEFRIGDIVLITTDYFIVGREEEGFILRRTYDWQGKTGHHSSVEALRASINYCTYVHYSRDEYGLLITRISKSK